jgi:hypothetical protein
MRVSSSNSSTPVKKGSYKALSETFGTWQGDDAEEIAKLIKSTKTTAEF